MSDSGRDAVDGRLSGGSESRESGDKRQTREEDGGGVVAAVEESGFGWVRVAVGLWVKTMMRLRKDQEEERALVVLRLRDGEE